MVCVLLPAKRTLNTEKMKRVFVETEMRNAEEIRSTQMRNVILSESKDK